VGGVRIPRGPSDMIGGFEGETWEVYVMAKTKFKNQTWVRLKIIQNNKPREVFAYWDKTIGDLRLVNVENWEYYTFITDERARFPLQEIEVTHLISKGKALANLYWVDGTTVIRDRGIGIGKAAERVFVVSKRKDKKGQWWIVLKVIKNGKPYYYEYSWNGQDIEKRVVTSIMIKPRSVANIHWHELLKEHPDG
jgi:hypothetical protein